MSVPEQKFVSTLRQGAVYFAPTRVGSPNYHFCIVMNENPTADDLVLLEIISSQVEKTKRRVTLQQHYASSAVELDQAMIAFLNKPSVVDCNSCLEYMSLRVTTAMPLPTSARSPSRLSRR